MTISNRFVSVTFTDGLDITVVENAAENLDSPGSIQLYDLATGNNTITLPPASPTSATIIPPVGNEESIVLKGVVGDTGIVLNPTDPTVLTFDPEDAPVSFVLNVSDDIDNVRIVWA